MVKSKNKSTYLIRDLDTSLWNKFMGICRTSGSSARSVLISLIEKYVKDHNNKKENKNMTYERLQELENMGSANIEKTAYDGACQLWAVNGLPDKYVVLPDNTVITQTEDNSGMEEPIFKNE